MATLTHGGLFSWLAPSNRVRAVAGKSEQSKKVYEFTKQAYRKTGGATPDLKRVYMAYVENQKKHPK